MKKIVLSAFILMAFSCTPSRNKVEKTQPFVTREAAELATNLLSSFNDTLGNSIEYPDYYGGVYVDSGKCFIMIVGDTLNAKKDILARCLGKGFILILCNNSRNSLQRIIDRLNIFLMHNEEQSRDLKMYGFFLDEVHNKIVVMTGDTSVANIAHFKSSVMNSPLIDFQKSNPIQFDEEVIDIK